MTVQRYTIYNYDRDFAYDPSDAVPDDAGQWVEYEVARQTIQRLGDELFAARTGVKAMIADYEHELRKKDAEIAALRQAVIALGYSDPDERP